MIKKSFAVLMLLAVFTCMTVPAFADILWEPLDDNYYQENMGNFDYVGRSFYTNGADGCVTVYKEPAGKEQVDVLPNGCRMYVSFEEDKGGKKWGVIQYEYKDGTYTPSWDWDTSGKIIRTGWVPMDSMWLIYDYQSFEEEHEDEFENYTGDAREFIGKEIYCWKYPGAESYNSAMTVSDFDGGMELSFSRTWLDEEGRLWGDMNYYYGVRDCWVCLSDPENDSLPTVQRGEPLNLVPTDTAKVEKGASGTGNSLYLVLAFSMILICIGGIVFITLKRKGKINKE